MARERRAQPRYDIVAQIRVKRGSVNYLMDVRNISMSGAFISSDKLSELSWAREGTQMEIHLFDLEDRRSVDVEASIVRVVGPGEPGKTGFGVRFGKLDEERTRSLFEMVAFASTQSIHPPPLPGLG